MEQGWKLPDLRGVSCPLCPLLGKSTGDGANPHGYWLSPMSPVSPSKNVLSGKCQSPMTASRLGIVWPRLPVGRYRVRGRRRVKSLRINQR